MRNNLFKKALCMLWVFIAVAVNTTANAQSKKVTGTVTDTNGPLV